MNHSFVEILSRCSIFNQSRFWRFSTKEILKMQPSPDAGVATKSDESIGLRPLAARLMHFVNRSQTYLARSQTMCMTLSQQTRDQLKARRDEALHGEATRILRDAAFVLEMTRRVKEQLLAEHPERAVAGE
jgi:hypothetical protein